MLLKKLRVGHGVSKLCQAYFDLLEKGDVSNVLYVHM